MSPRVSPGKYTAIARKWKLAESDNTHTPFVSVAFELLDEHVLGIEMSWAGWLNDDKAGKDGKTSLDRTLESMRACGWRGADLGDLTGLGDRRVTVTIDDEVSKSTGKSWPKIKFVNALGGGGGLAKTDLAPSKLRELVAVSRQKAAALPVMPLDSGAPVATPRDVGADDEPF